MEDCCLLALACSAYLLMKARTEEGKNFLCLRNPWGDHEWLGDWSDTSECWTEHLKEALGMQEADDGIFWMIEDDFFYYFTSIDIARPIPDNLACQLTLGNYQGLTYGDYCCDETMTKNDLGREMHRGQEMVCFALSSV